MKINRKLVALLMVISLIAAAVPAVSAAGFGGGSYEAGTSVEVGFQFADALGVQGTISFSNPDLFVEDVHAVNPVFVGDGETYNANTLFWMGWNNKSGKSLGINYKLTISPDAKAGDSCTVTYTYEYTLPNYDISEVRTESVTITVKASPVKPTDPTTPTQPKPPATKIDYAELNEQINIANGLKQDGYTDESWAALQEALKNAKAAKNSKNQAAVDAAAQALKDAIAGLVEMDYSKLIAAIGDVEELCKNDELADLFKQLYDAVAEGKELLHSGNQKAVDECTAKILDLLAKVIAKLKELNEVETVVVEKEVEVEVLPSGEYCNIEMHKVWPILFWISLALNVGFIAVIVVYIVKKKKNQKDNTPLVDYDISDDE